MIIEITPGIIFCLTELLEAFHSSCGVSFGTNTFCERMLGMLHLMKDDTER